jgi:hypothetical protein
MDLSSLPNYPQANPPQQPQPAAGDEPAAPERWGTMFLQLAIIAGVWAGIYLLNQYSRNISEAFARDEAKRKQAEDEAKKYAALVGKWQSTHGDGTILELRRVREFSLNRERRSGYRGLYSLQDGKLVFRIPGRDAYFPYWYLRYQVSRQELVVWGDDWFRRVVLGRDPRPDEPRPLEVRFRRIGE